MIRKTILAVLGVDHGDDDLVAAAAIAQRSEAYLNAIVISRVPPPPIDELTGQAYSTYSFVWEEEDARVKTRAEKLRSLLAERGSNADVRPVYCLKGNVSDEVASRAAYSDLTVIGKSMLEDTGLLKSVLDGALFDSPAPVLLSVGGEPSLAPRTLLVAWNSTLECGVAVRHSMDMLVRAQKVHVVIVDPTATASSMGEEPGSDIAKFLSRHGVEVTVEVLASGGFDPALVLQRHATDIGADLIVMGAYGHSRMRERFFGGTTQTMLGNIGTPVLMAH